MYEEIAIRFICFGVGIGIGFVLALEWFKKTMKDKLIKSGLLDTANTKMQSLITTLMEKKEKEDDKE